MSCPKCGDMFGQPRFTKLPYSQRECLKYTCMRCGYVKTGPCKDAKDILTTKDVLKKWFGVP